MKNPNIKIFDSKNELAINSAQFIIELANKFIKEKGRFSIALSGGSTPKLLYDAILSNFKDSVDWSRIDFFWSDERYVPIDHSDSNIKLAVDFLLNPLHIKNENIYLIDTSLNNPEETAKLYEEKIRKYFAGEAQFDLILLGLGDDGHTASLFPGTIALQEKDKLVAANWVKKFQSWRITFTFPLINKTKNVMFISSGINKADVLQKILENKKYPAAKVSPADGDLYWFLDQDAASQMT